MDPTVVAPQRSSAGKWAVKGRAAAAAAAARSLPRGLGAAWRRGAPLPPQRPLQRVPPFPVPSCSYLPQSVSVQLHSRGRQGKPPQSRASFALVARHTTNTTSHFRFPLFTVLPTPGSWGVNVFAQTNTRYRLASGPLCCFKTTDTQHPDDYRLERPDDLYCSTVATTIAALDGFAYRAPKDLAGESASYLNRSHHSMSLDRPAETIQSTPSPTMSSTTTSCSN
jgi:hypothetical protein